jgi:hypothetical protein
LDVHWFDSTEYDHRVIFEQDSGQRLCLPGNKLGLHGWRCNRVQVQVVFVSVESMFAQAGDDAAALGLPTCVAPYWAGDYTCIDMMSE